VTRYFDSSFSLPTGQRYLIRQVIDFLARLDSTAPQEGQWLVDLGCGRAPYRTLFHRYRYLGIDALPSVSSPDVFAEVRGLPIRSRGVAACLTVWVLDDLPDPEVAIAEVARILQPGGYYFAVEAQWAQQHFPPRDYFRFAPNALIHLAGKHGLELASYSSYGGDFGVIGFSLIHVIGLVNQRLGKVGMLLDGLCRLVINGVLGPLDRLARLPRFRGVFETNSIGYCYVFRKTG
jgi:SAM-dependent methyltransferase